MLDSAMSDQPYLPQLKALLASARSVAVLTGAGISTESGIPDYRSPGGIWSKMEPISFQEFISNEDARLEDWRRRFVMNADFADAQPNIGHDALVRMEAAGKLAGIITQNIDGMHQRSGIAVNKLVELHGNATYGACLECELSMSLEAIKAHIDQEGTSPLCSACGGIVKAAVISFGQEIRYEALDRALHMTRTCDVFMAIGSSLRVEPAARLPLIAQRCGAELIIINDETTPFDDLADCVCRDKISNALTWLASAC